MSRRGAIAVVIAVIAVVFLTVVALQALDRAEQSSDDAGQVRATAAVERRTLEDAIIVRGIAGYPTTGTLIAKAAGLVTSIDVEAGSTVEAGTTILSVDGRAMVAVEGDTPFWRELQEGASGADVAQLQSILEAAGLGPGTNEGTFDAETTAALTTWQAEHGYAAPDGVLRLNDMVTGTWPRRVGAVTVRQASFVDPGTELLSYSTNEPAVSIELLPSDRLRVSPGLPARVELEATGSTVSGELAEVASEPVVREDGSLLYPGRVVLDEALGAPEGTQVRVALIVDRVEDVLTIPLAALISDGSGSTAVRVAQQNSTEVVPVEIGLSEGAWVEVISGLMGDERVVVAGE